MNRPETDFIKRGIKKYGVSPALLRLKLWKIQMSATRVLCSELDIEFMEFPSFACDLKGFVKPEYYADDATHVNELYGEHVLKELYDLASSTTGVVNNE